MRRRLLFALPALALLGGCDMVVLSPSGYVAVQQRDMLVNATLLMLLVIVPVALFNKYQAEAQERRT